jgi:hypothetical protein
MQRNETIQQLYNATWSPLVDGIQAWCGCSFSDDGLTLDDAAWAGCVPLLRAAKETNTKFQLVIVGSIPDARLEDVDFFVMDALAMHHHLHVDGFSIDDERDCAPRATTDDFLQWTRWQSKFAQGLANHHVPVTSAIQSVFAINDTPGNQPCAKKPAEYDLDPNVVDILQTASLQKWLVMDTYYFSTARFMGALDWHVAYVPRETLGIGMMNRSDLSESDLVARFHAIDKSGVDWINIFMMPIADEFLPFLQRWKTFCAGCGKQTILGCYDMTEKCDEGLWQTGAVQSVDL